MTETLRACRTNRTSVHSLMCQHGVLQCALRAPSAQGLTLQEMTNSTDLHNFDLCGTHHLTLEVVHEHAERT